MSRAQVAVEFVLLIGVLFTALIIFIYFVSANFQDVSDDTDYFQTKDIALSIKAEINMVNGLESGFRRDFFVPFTVDGVEYNITMLSNTSIIFDTGEVEYLINVPPFDGDLVKGNNYIRKVNGLVKINE